MLVWLLMRLMVLLEMSGFVVEKWMLVWLLMRLMVLLLMVRAGVMVVQLMLGQVVWMRMGWDLPQLWLGLTPAGVLALAFQWIQRMRVLLRMRVWLWVRLMWLWVRLMWLFEVKVRLWWLWLWWLWVLGSGLVWYSQDR